LAQDPPLCLRVFAMQPQPPRCFRERASAPGLIGVLHVFIFSGPIYIPFNKSLPPVIEAKLGPYPAILFSK